MQIPLVVRERDCACDGRLDESVLLVFFREARRAYVGVLNAEDVRQQVRDARFSVYRDIRLDDELAVRVRCDEADEMAFRMVYAVRDRATDEVVAEGSTVSVLVDEAGFPALVPEHFRRRIDALEGRGG